ncbi:MAG: sensor histidine kinase, partial [Acetobacteraceae bacterium]
SEEIRKPLHAVVGLCGVMMANCRPDQREPLGRVQSSSKQLVEMIENLIDLAHIDRRPIRVEPVDVDRMVHEAADAIRPTAADKQIAVAVDPEPGPPRIVQADAWAIRRILDNLLANALRFSPRGAVVELVTETQPDRVEVIVRDTGVGMPSDALRRLEEPLPPIEADRGSPDDATDTGLTLSRRLARAIGAELVFDSEPGSGTTVTLRLPN